MNGDLAAVQPFSTHTCDLPGATRGRKHISFGSQVALPEVLHEPGGRALVCGTQTALGLAEKETPGTRYLSSRSHDPLSWKEIVGGADPRPFLGSCSWFGQLVSTRGSKTGELETGEEYVHGWAQSNLTSTLC